MVDHRPRSPKLFASESQILIPTAVLTHTQREPTLNIRSLSEFFKRNEGLFALIAGQLFFSVAELSVKNMTALDVPVPLLEVITVQMGIVYICSQTCMFASGVAHQILGPKDVRILLVLRGIFGFICLFGIYCSLQYLSLPDVTVLGFLIPVVTATLGILFLREAASWKQGVAGLASMLGVILIAQPTLLFDRRDVMHASAGTGAGAGAGETIISETRRIVGVGVALIGVLGGGCAFFIIRVIGKRAHPMHMMSYFSFWSVLFSAVTMFATNTKWVLPTQWVWSFTLIGIVGFVGQLFLTLGLQLETAFRGSIAFYTKIVFALVLQRIVYGDSPSGLSQVGICVIMASAIYVALSKEGSEPVNSTSTPAWDRNGTVEEGRSLLSNYDRGDAKRNTGYGAVGRRA